MNLRSLSPKYHKIKRKLNVISFIFVILNITIAFAVMFLTNHTNDLLYSSFIILLCLGFLTIISRVIYSIIKSYMLSDYKVREFENIHTADELNGIYHNRRFVIPK